MKRLLTPANLRLAVEIVLVIAALTFAFSRSSPSEAASGAAPAAPAALYWYQCNAPNFVGLFYERIHVYCTSTSPIAGAPALSAAIYWFAVPTTDSAAASRFLSLFQSASIAAKVLWVQVDPNDTSGSAFGCGSANCRRIFGAELR